MSPLAVLASSLVRTSSSLRSPDALFAETEPSSPWTSRSVEPPAMSRSEPGGHVIRTSRSPPQLIWIGPQRILSRCSIVITWPALALLGADDRRPRAPRRRGPAWRRARRWCAGRRRSRPARVRSGAGSSSVTSPGRVESLHPRHLVLRLDVDVGSRRTRPPSCASASCELGRRDREAWRSRRGCGARNMVVSFQPWA